MGGVKGVTPTILSITQGVGSGWRYTHHAIWVELIGRGGDIYSVPACAIWCYCAEPRSLLPILFHQLSASCHQAKNKAYV